MKLKRIDIIFSAFLGVAAAAAPYYINAGICKFTLDFACLALTDFVLFVFLFSIIRSAVGRYAGSGQRLKEVPGYTKLVKSRRAALILAAVMLICWLPALLALYPGTLINDTWGQLSQFLYLTKGFHSLYDHHPVAATLWMGSLITFFFRITNNWHTSFFIYVFIQAVFTSLAFSCSILYANNRLKVGQRASLCMLLLYCMLPLFPASVQTICKDALSAWIFVFFFLCFLECVRTQGKALGSIKFVLCFTLLALLCALTKKVNTYVILFSLLGLFVFIKEKNLRLLIPVSVLAAAMFLVMPWLMERFEISPGGKQEMFSIPFQQTARYVKDHPDDISEEEYAAIDNLLDMSDLADRYNPISADPVKGYRELGTKEDYIRYIKVWFAQGLRHPESYFHAACAMFSGWFSSNEYDPVMNMKWHSQLLTRFFAESTAERQGIFEKTADAYQEFYHNLYKTPLLMFFFSYSTYAVVLPTVTLSAAIGRKTRKKYWLAWLPIIFSLLLGCFLAPVSIHFEGRRYLYPITYTLPLLIAWCIFACSGSDSDEARSEKEGNDG